MIVEAFESVDLVIIVEAVDCWLLLKLLNLLITMLKLLIVVDVESVAVDCC